ncbi:AzlD domain-containing protein [Citricoccus muralis]|uniref:AzlD domain-containing protein n=1 Tax=Citricoccus muralis TaxID=169134 RepID=A0ABY8H7X9_9MICC|nr:AzlD domain-containing protein [Citricoccus muralis]WFP17256.1 AzlD domain-containing protein [Citricoccus muralis]
MSLWFWILLASVIAFATKFVGYLMPQAWLEHERVLRTANAVTIGLLAALVAMNALGDGTSLTADSRIGALVAAAVALIHRAPFLVVVLVGAIVAAGLRLLGFP